MSRSMSPSIDVTVPVVFSRIFAPLVPPARYKGAWGGRGSGKSHFFAELLIVRCLTQKTDWVCIREVQKTLAQSAKKLLESKIASFGVGHLFEVLSDRIRTPHGGQIIFQGMQDHTADSIKSLEGFDGAWVEEAQSLSARSLMLLRPTIRKAGSELWFSWNPRTPNDPVDLMLRGAEAPTGAVVVRANWNDNRRFPAELEQERQDCLRISPDPYDHIWEGGYVTVTEGAFFARELTQAKAEGRIGRVAADPMLSYRLFFDIGGTGARADAVAIWVAQFVGREIRVLDYAEGQGQPLSFYVAWMRERGYSPGRASVWLPHDGDTHDTVFDVSYRSALEAAGYTVTIIPNQGKGAAGKRIERVRQLFPAIWFHADTTGAGRAALGWYHEKKDEVRGIGLGPDHDWSSHAADAFGAMCVAYAPPRSSGGAITIPGYGAV